MSQAVLLDSDILIEVLRGRNEEILARWSDLIRAEGLLAYSAVTAAEIWHGVRDSEQASVSDMFTALTCIPVDADIGRRAGDYLRHFRRSHQLALGDALIAATASLHDLHLWTRNRKHYPMSDIRFF